MLFHKSIFVTVGLLAFASACTNNSDCDYLMECYDKRCVHKSVFPLTYLEGLAFLMTILTSCLAVISGLGGGVLYTAGFIIILNFTANQAVPISTFNIVVSMMLKFIWEMIDRYKKKSPSNVRYDIASMFAPSVMVGSQFGVMLNILLRPWMLSILLCIIVSISSIPSFSKGIKLYRKEQSERIKRKRTESVQKEPEEEPVLEEVPKVEDIVIKTASEKSEDYELEESVFGKGMISSFVGKKSKKEVERLTEEDPKISTENRKDSPLIKQPTEEKEMEKDSDVQTHYKNRDMRLFPLDFVIFIFVSIISLFIVTILKGRKGSSVIGTTACTPVWWLLSFIMIPIALTIIVLFVLKIKKETRRRVSEGAKREGETIDWSTQIILKMIFFGLLVGVVSALLGVGGSFLTVPLFLKFGLTPQLSSSTSSFISMLSSISSAVQYMIFNLLDYDYSFMTAIGTLIGASSALLWFLPYFRNNNKQSYIVFTLIVALYLSAALNLWIGIREIKNDNDKGKVWEFRKMC